MAESRAPQGSEWADGVEVLHGLANLVTVRSLYKEGHPAIARADELAAAGFNRLLDRLPELVVALLDGELVVAERPMPELRKRLGALADAMEKHEIECLVFQRGISIDECTVLGRTLASPPDAEAPGRAREQAQSNLVHVLLRYAELRAANDANRRGDEATYFEPFVEQTLHDVARSLAEEKQIDRLAVTALAQRIVFACAGGVFALQLRCWAQGIDDLCAHSTNVAMMTAAMTLEGGWDERVCVDATAAALLHDVGHLFLPPQLRNVPDPFLDDTTRPIFRNHCFAGASALLGAGCPSLWVAVALEHHRGVDGKGYPALESKDGPHDLVRVVALASFFDRKRTAIAGFVAPGGVQLVAPEGAHLGDDPEQALRRAAALENRFFHARELDLFVRALGVFPPGTTLELSDRRPAVVTRAKTGDPLRPNVRLLHGPDGGKRVELRALDAVEDRFVLSVARAMPPPLMPFDRASDDAIDVTELLVAAEEIAPESAPPISPPPMVEVPVSLSRMPRVVVSSTSLPAARTSGTYPTDVSPRTKSDERIEPDWSNAASSLPPALSRAPIAPPPPSPPPPHADDEARLVAQIVSLRKIPRMRMSPDAITKLPLDHRAGFVLTLIDGLTSIEDIIDASGIARIDVLRVLVDLIGRGAITLD